LEFNPLREVEYRARLSTGYLERAERLSGAGYYKESAESSQLSVENAAKAIIALRRVPSWSHDPSHELAEVAEELPASVRKLAKELASS